MKLKTLSMDRAFEVVHSLHDVQAAEMVLAPGTSTGGPDNRHMGADQWLFVVSGAGLAVIEGVEHELKAGSLLVIERGETHELQVDGDQPLRTVSFYSPPAYDSHGNRLPAGKS